MRSGFLRAVYRKPGAGEPGIGTVLYCVEEVEDDGGGYDAGVLFLAAVGHREAYHPAVREYRLAPASTPPLEARSGAVYEVLVPPEVVLVDGHLDDGAGHGPDLARLLEYQELDRLVDGYVPVEFYGRQVGEKSIVLDGQNGEVDVVVHNFHPGSKVFSHHALLYLDQGVVLHDIAGR